MPASRSFDVLRFVALFALTTMVSACGGGGGTSAGGGGGIPAGPQPTATPVPTAPPSSSPGTLSVSTANPASTSIGPTADGYTGSIGVSAGSNAAMLAVGMTSTQPAGTPVVQSIRRMAKDLAPGQTLTVRTFVTLTPNTTVSFTTSPSFSVTMPALPTRQEFDYVADYDPTHASQGWQVVSDTPAAESAALLTFASAPANVTFTGGVSYDFVIFSVNTPLP